MAVERPIDKARGNASPKAEPAPKAIASWTAERALPWLFERYSAQLHNLTRRICRSEDEAEDLVQEVFLLGFRAWDQFDGRAKPTTWFYTIASHACQRRHRLRAGEPATMDSLEDLLPSPDGYVADLRCDSDDPFRNQVERETREAVESAIATLAQQGARQQPIGQQMAQQQKATQQQQLAQMDQTMQRLHQLEQQAAKLAQNMAQRPGQTGAGQNGARDQSMQQLCDSVANLTGDMTKTMDRIHQNLQDPALIQDRDMLKDLDRLRLHVEDMAGPLEDALKTMDRIQDRLHQPGSGS